MEYYALVKHIHLATGALSLIGFIIRGWWMMKESPALEHKLVKILPHINDTLLLSAAIYLSIVTKLYPFVESWLGLKVILLVGYIVAGTIALKRGKSKQSKIIAFIIALVCILAIFGVAGAKPVLY